mgnify:CR=1 FL=1
MNEIVNPCWILLDGDNPPFRSYMDVDEVARVQRVGFKHAQQINLKETDDRPIPQNLKDGITMIEDIYITLIPGPGFNG